MILTFPQLSNIVLNNPNRDLVVKGQRKSKMLRMHMYGEGLEDCIKQIEGFEKMWIKKLRVQYARSNKDLFSRLGRAVDKVFSARGGSTYYNLSAAQERRAVALSGNIRDGYNIKDWLENFWQAHYKDDPCGVIMMELLPEQQARLARREGRSFTYPTYKSIMAIHDYLPKGVMLEYISFQLEKDELIEHGYREDQEVYRVVDDAKDYYVIVERSADKVTVDESKTIPNYFGKVPAIINSDIVDPECKKGFLSIYDDIVPLANEFLLKGSIKITSDFRHGFPKYAEFADDCPDCNGEGVRDGDDCGGCKGSGKVIRLRPTDDKLMSWPDKDQHKILPSETGGYIEPSKVFYEIAVSDMNMLENYMCLTMWGVTSRIKTQGLNVNADGVAKTATEELMEIKPQADRLTHISKSAEKRHRFILDLVIQMMIEPAYKGASVNYGRRYMLEGPDALWDKYEKARKAGVSISALNDLLLEYYEAKYASDPVKLAVQTKLIAVEPMVHYKASEVGPFRLSEEDYKAKIFYSDWLAAQPSGFIYGSTAQQLRDSLYKYAAGKTLAAPEPAATIAA